MTGELKAFPFPTVYTCKYKFKSQRHLYHKNTKSHLAGAGHSMYCTSCISSADSVSPQTLVTGHQFIHSSCKLLIPKYSGNWNYGQGSWVPQKKLLGLLLVHCLPISTPSSRGAPENWRNLGTMLLKTKAKVCVTFQTDTSGFLFGFLIYLAVPGLSCNMQDL